MHKITVTSKMNVHARLKEIEELDSFINSKKQLINSVLETLEWTEESLNDKLMVNCPINSEHWVPESSLPEHKKVCQWVKDGYSKEEWEKESSDSNFFYEKASNVIPLSVDKTTLERILSERGLPIGNVTNDFPRTADRWNIQLSSEQRLAVYDYLMEASAAAEKSKVVKLEDLIIDFEKKDEQDDKPKSQLEILAELRDYKRRRQSYRAKNVHITKKSYTEIMKEVIENQINYLVETRKCEEPQYSKKDSEDSNHYKRKHSHNAYDHELPDDPSPKRDNHSGHKRDDDEYYYKRHHSKRKSSKHNSPKRKKHKKDRSRSRSPSHHKHKKSHKRKLSCE